ncbi:MAG: Molybdopterin adenylyltransferase [Methanoregulaceae archaeon PtaU1.Bin059]|nr:MAG: Molybdopterin adenylyltransferase [Methanoregulaceae archaeon PtaB.Bin152]OPY42165.1 MAG: Molybdopterin adenylyltransferase [Methanoregulaceae archaeon PtaU1.Bin059]
MQVHHERPVHISAAVITVSSTRTTENDSSGKEIMHLLEMAGISVGIYTIVRDDIEEIRREVLTSFRSCNCVIVNGGTGLTPDDCTIEAVSPLMEKKIDGFGELFRAKSMEEIGTPAMLSRAVAGVCHGKAVFCIPGSTAAVTLATRDLIIPELRHIISHATKRH